MKTHIEPRYDETYVTETLDNGLRVIVWHKPLMRTTSCVFATPYGALDFDLTAENGERFHHPSGIAHFLEHKMFEKEGQDVMNEFSRMGANVNAFTSYQETMYYFSTSSEEIEAPLTLLLDFVQELNITDASVEKEKGIITQELMMYLQMPDSRLYFEVFKALYQNHPLKYDIGGSPTSVANTTRQQLEECYRLNYHPGRMLLVVAGPHEPSEVLNIIRKNQDSKQFAPLLKVGRTPIEEPQEPAKKKLLIPMEVTSEKTAVAFKLKPWVSTDHERVHDEWAIRCALEAHFSAMNPDYQKWIDEGLINDYFDYEIDLQKDTAFLLFVNETSDRSRFESLIQEELARCLRTPIGFEALNRLKKRYFGQAMRTFNSVENIAIGAARNDFNGVSVFELLEILDQLDQTQVMSALQHLSLQHSALVSIVPMHEKTAE